MARRTFLVWLRTVAGHLACICTAPGCSHAARPRLQRVKGPADLSGVYLAIGNLPHHWLPTTRFFCRSLRPAIALVPQIRASLPDLHNPCRQGTAAVGFDYFISPTMALRRDLVSRIYHNLSVGKIHAFRCLGRRRA